MNPKLIFLFCGKRKSGKDFLTESLCKRINEESEQAVILRLSGPLKKCYAENHGLDFDRLLDASEYKEKYRKDMISWSEKIRNEDPSYFCLKAIEAYEGCKFPIWIVSDCRRRSDFHFFLTKYGSDVCKTVRVYASESVRESRGFTFQAGIDDAESECGLDGEKCDFCIENNGNIEPHELLKDLLKLTV